MKHIKTRLVTMPGNYQKMLYIQCKKYMIKIELQEVEENKMDIYFYHNKKSSKIATVTIDKANGAALLELYRNFIYNAKLLIEKDIMEEIKQSIHFFYQYTSSVFTDISLKELFEHNNDLIILNKRNVIKVNNNKKAFVYIKNKQIEIEQSYDDKTKIETILYDIYDRVDEYALLKQHTTDEFNTLLEKYVLYTLIG